MNKSFFSEYIYTLLAGLLVLIINVAILKLMANYLSIENFGIFLISRRIIALGIPVISFSFGMGLAKYISNNKKIADYLLAKLIILSSIIFLFLLIIIVLYNDYFSMLLFNNKNYSILLMAVSFCIFGSSFQMICHSYFRGLLQFKIMNIVYIIFWPLLFVASLAIIYFSSSEDILFNYFISYSLIILLTNLIVLNIFKQKTSARFFTNLHKFNFEDKKFLKYGIVRIPQGFFSAAIFFLPLWFSTIYISLKDAAIIGILIAVIRLFQSFILPFNLILLPKFAQMQSSKNYKFIKNDSQLIVNYFFTVPLFIGLLLMFFSREIIYIWFGSSYSHVISYLLFISPFVSFYILYGMINGILDGIYDFPYSNLITFGGMLTVVIFSYISVYLNWNTMGLVIAFALGLIILGLLSIIIIVKKLKLNIFNTKNILSIIWFIIHFFIIYFLNLELNKFDLNIYIIIIKILITSLIIIISLYFYNWLGYNWIQILTKNKIKRAN